MHAVARLAPDYRSVQYADYTISNGVWVDVVYHVRWSPYNDGFVEAWIRNVPDTSTTPPPYVKFLDKIDLRTLFNDEGNYFKTGLFRSTSNDPADIANRGDATVYYDEIRFGNSFDEVAIAPTGLP